MRVIVLGAGGMGAYAATTAAGFDFIDDLVVGDLDEGAAARLAENLGPTVRHTRVDVNDEAGLTGALAGADVVLNTVGPFFRLGPPVLRAAIRAKSHYLDINDDWESTEAMLAMGPEARAAGITAVLGMGASPGVSNLLAITAARELDTVKEIYAGFDLDAAMPETRRADAAAATVHGLHQLTGLIRVFDGGELNDQPPLREIPIDYPGLGRFRAWTMGHPEAITFPQIFPDLERSLVVMVMKPSNRFAVQLASNAIDWGLLSIERAARWLEWLEGVGKPVPQPDDYLAEITRSGRLPPLFSIARGLKNGTNASVGATILSAPAVGMGGATGVPLALALSVLRPEGETKRGVFPAETIIDPDLFFDCLAPLCTPVKKNRDDLLLVSRSWENRDLRNELRQI